MPSCAESAGCFLPFDARIPAFPHNTESAMQNELSDAQLLRYSRHILLNEIGMEGQEKLCRATVLVVGCGGLGTAVLPYLTASGVGRLILADDDTID